MTQIQESTWANIHRAIYRSGLTRELAGPVDSVDVAQQEEGAPYNWVRVYDDHISACGDADDIAKALSYADSPETFWESLREFPDHYPNNE